LKKVNDLLLQDNPAGMFVTTTIVIGSKQSGEILYANAGHNPPIICSATSQITELPKGQIALGVLDDQVYLDHKLEIDPNSYIILYSDGVTDTASPTGEYYSTQRLIQFISTNRFKRAENLTNALENNLIQFRAGMPSVDDITVLALRRY
jgi:phosphoserine phosphatase RsbU/P